jgi:hypothetical protein
MTTQTAVGEAANQRLFDAQASAARPGPNVVTLKKVGRPSTTGDRRLAPGRGSGDIGVMNVLSTILGFLHRLVGSTNAELLHREARLLKNLSYLSRQPPLTCGGRRQRR